MTLQEQVEALKVQVEQTKGVEASAAKAYTGTSQLLTEKTVDLQAAQADAAEKAAQIAELTEKLGLSEEAKAQLTASVEELNKSLAGAASAGDEVANLTAELGASAQALAAAIAVNP